jgi:hypothetical protein
MSFRFLKFDSESRNFSRVVLGMWTPILVDGRTAGSKTFTLFFPSEYFSNWRRRRKLPTILPDPANQSPKGDVPCLIFSNLNRYVSREWRHKRRIIEKGAEEGSRGISNT